MDTDRLKVSLLGSPEVIINQSPIFINRKILRNLLYYLACQEQPVSRAALCELFWPNISEAEARKNLRESISKLRSEFPFEDVIITRDDLILLNPARVSVDMLKFERVVSQLRRNLDLINNGHLPEATYADIREALALWRAPQFLAGVVPPESIAYQNWIFQTSESLFYWRQMMMEWMADHCIAIGNLNEALYWLSTALINDRLNVELNYLTLNCLKDLGVKSEALHYCDFLESIFQENGITTLPVVLKELIVRVREEPDVKLKKLPIIWNLYEGKEVNFLGQADLVQVLTQFVHRGGLVLLRGEPSSGKTRLLKEFYTNLEVIPRLIYCRARKGESHLAYQPLVDGLRNGVLDEEWRQIDLIYAQTLYPLFPEIAKIRNDLDTHDLEHALSLQRLIPEAFHKLSALLAYRKRLLFIMDDAQWSDENSLKVLSYIHERGGAIEIGTGILVTRNDETNPYLASFFSVETKTRLVDVIDVQPLTDDQVDEISRSLIGFRPSQNFIHWLKVGSGGNIGYLLEILDQIQPFSVEIEKLAECRTWPISPHLADLLDERIQKISDFSRRLLPILAVMGDKIDLTLINTMTTMTISQVNACLVELQKKQILLKNESIPGVEKFEFVHGVIREKILERLDPVSKITIEKKIKEN